MARQSKIYWHWETTTALNFVWYICKDLLLCVRVGVREVAEALNQLVGYQQRERGSGLGSAGRQ